MTKAYFLSALSLWKAGQTAQAPLCATLPNLNPKP